MKRQSAALCRTLTDSDIKLDKAGAVCDPAMATNTSTSSAGRVSLDLLHKEILEEIFCRLPTVDLVDNCALTCRRFNEIISNGTYLYWKKLYIHYLKKEAGAVQQVDNSM